MARFGNATPLIALDAFVIDTETTGLDPAKARVVEIGAVPLRSGKLDEAAALRQLVNPGEPIPAEATRIHAIDDSWWPPRRSSPPPGRISRPQRQAPS